MSVVSVRSLMRALRELGFVCPVLERGTDGDSFVSQAFDLTVRWPKLRLRLRPFY